MSEPKNWYPLRSVTSAKEKMAKNSRKVYYEEEQKRIEEKQQRQQENNAKYGNGKYRNEGMVARIFGEYLLDLSSTKLTKNDLQSFMYGYYEASNRQISLMCSENKTTDFIETAAKTLTKTNNEEVKNLSVSEILFDIGYRDSHDSNINVNDFEEVVRKNKDYLEGYMTGIEEAKKSGRGIK